MQQNIATNLQDMWPGYSSVNTVNMATKFTTYYSAAAVQHIVIDA